MDDEAFLEDMDMDDDYDDLDDEDFSIVQQKTIKPAPKNTDTVKRKRGRPRKKDIVSSDDEFEPVFKKEIFDDDFLFGDDVFNFHDKLQNDADKTGKTSSISTERETRKLRSKRIQENKSIC